MDKIDINKFTAEQTIIYHWTCQNCDTNNFEFEEPQFLEAIFCEVCGQTFEIIK